MRGKNLSMNIKKFRKNNPGLLCKRCGKTLKYSIHHFYCNRCWYLKDI